MKDVGLSRRRVRVPTYRHAIIEEGIKVIHHENKPIYFDPLKSHFYIVKLRFTGVFIIFLISAQNIDCGYSLEPPRRGGSNEYSQSMF